MVSDGFEFTGGSPLILVIFFEFYSGVCFDVSLPINSGRFDLDIFDGNVGDYGERSGGEGIVVTGESLTVRVGSSDS